MNNGILYIVATPIGNLEDLSLRAARVLSEVDFVLAEDTRVTGKLFTLAAGPASGASPSRAVARERSDSEVTRGSTKSTALPRLVSFHQHSSEDKISAIIRELENGRNYALVTDAGTPNISDPGGEARRGGARGGYQSCTDSRTERGERLSLGLRSASG